MSKDSDDPDGSAWIEITSLEESGRYQHFVNRDGRHKWRPLATPEDESPAGWRVGLPPKDDEQK